MKRTGRVLELTTHEARILEEYVERARAEEREACARIADEMYDPSTQPEFDVAHDIALEIRARSKDAPK